MAKTDLNKAGLYMAFLSILLGLILLSPAKGYSFNSFPVDSTKAAPKDSTRDTAKKVMWLKQPSGVALRSAIIPGLGQISNRQVWKVPIIYAGLATSGYFIYDNNKQFQRFRVAYRYRTDNDTNTIDEFDPNPLNPHPAKEGRISSEQSLLQLREDYRRYRDLSIIITFGIYAANILDAYVYAHLKDFDVSENLALAVEPVNFTNIAGNRCAVASIKLKLK